MRPQPLIAVHDVEASSRWYQVLLGCESAHGGPEYERLEVDGVLVMQLHHFDVEHDHGHIGDPDARLGNGVLLWFEIDDFDAALGGSTRSARRSCSRRTGTLPRGSRAVPRTARSGYTISTATPSSSRAPTAKPPEPRREEAPDRSRGPPEMTNDDC